MIILYLFKYQLNNHYIVWNGFLKIFAIHEPLLANSNFISYEYVH